MYDDGYGGGKATLSALAAAGISSTFCNDCYLGITSAGKGSGVGSPWNNYVLDDVMRGAVQDQFIQRNPASYKTWSQGTDVHSPYVLGQGNRIKQNAVELIREWYGSQGVQIQSGEVYFFDDRTENIPPFQEKGLNSREISCASRDWQLYGGSGMVGYCGARPEEIVKDKGNVGCHDNGHAHNDGLQDHQEPACLCVFDIDRTLTGKQGDTEHCPGNVVKDMYDDGYGGGKATLSALAAAGISSTFCNDCYLGITSAGKGSGVGSPWNNYVLDDVMRGAVQDQFIQRNPASYKTWSQGTDVHSPYVLGQGNRIKQNAVELIREWYGSQGVQIQSGEVYFFDDRTENIPPFQEKGLNSREISCASRDWQLYGGSGMVGYCGARPEEIVKEKGNVACHGDGRTNGHGIN